MKEQAKQLREVARQALYSTPNDQECEVPIMVDTLRELVYSPKRFPELMEAKEAIKMLRKYKGPIYHYVE